jgi:hypothetical protein
MKISSIWEFSSIAGKVMMVLALAAMIGSIDVVPALGDDHDRRGKRDNSRYEHRGRGHDRDRYERYDNRPYGYGYRERVYAPIFAPPPPPGIGIFFPFPH